MIILPCPFCGTAAVVEIEEVALQPQLFVATIHCNLTILCGATISVVLRGKEDAEKFVVARWNQRGSI